MSSLGRLKYYVNLVNNEVSIREGVDNIVYDNLLDSLPTNVVEAINNANIEFGLIPVSYKDFDDSDEVVKYLSNKNNFAKLLMLLCYYKYGDCRYILRSISESPIKGDVFSELLHYNSDILTQYME